MTKVVYFWKIRTQEPYRYIMATITRTLGTSSPSSAAPQPTPSPATPRESPLKRVQTELSLEATNFRPVAFSMSPGALSAVSVAAQKQLARGLSDLDASKASLAARKVSTPR